MSSNAPASRSGPPLPIVAVVGVASLIIWVGALLFQIATSESQVLGTSIHGVSGLFSAINQWQYFASGDLSPMQQAAFIYAWGLEVFVLVSVTMFDIIAIGLKRGHSIVARVFGMIVLICFALDTGSDYNWLPSSLSFWGRILISALIAAAVAFLGVVAAICAEHLYKNW